MKKNLITGVLTFLPIAITVFLILYLFNLLTTPFVGLIENLIISYRAKHGFNPQHLHTLVVVISRVLVIFLLFFFILLLGYLARKLFFNAFLKITNKILSRIPIVKSIYRVAVDITKAFFSPGEKTFKRTVLIPFPNENTRALGFVTCEVPPEMKKVDPNLDLSIFVPTSPHPLSGFMIMTPKKYAQDLDMTIKESFKFLVSCGVIHPPADEEKKHQEKHDDSKK